MLRRYPHCPSKPIYRHSFLQTYVLALEIVFETDLEADYNAAPMRSQAQVELLNLFFAVVLCAKHCLPQRLLCQNALPPPDGTVKNALACALMEMAASQSS